MISFIRVDDRIITVRLLQDGLKNTLVMELSQLTTKLQLLLY